MNETEVLVAGAGPTGLMLALWLARAGVRVRVVDPKAGPTQETRAIVVHARTLEFYGQLGLGQEARARGRRLDHISLWVRGRRVGHVQLSDVGEDLTPYPYILVLTQNENEAMLLAHLERAGGRVDWQTELVGLRQDEVGVTATLRRGDGGFETVHARYLAGCDGASSAARKALGVGFPGGTYAQTAWVADAAATGRVREGELNLMLDDASFLAFFPMPGQDHYRILGQLPDGSAGTVTFEALRPEVEARAQTRVTAVHWFATYRVHHRVADHFRIRRAFLLGDAGHLHTPVGGQGMNTGLGDAANLAWKLAQVVQGGNEALLDSYEPERMPFARALVDSTDRAFAFIARSSETARFVRTRVAPVVVSLVSRLRPARRFLFRTVSQTKIHYPDSPLSQGQAGRIRGGDRLPWVSTRMGSNFDALRSLGWQLHVYGAPGPELLAWCARHALPLQVFAFTPAARHAGLAEDAPYLIRPDGYVGLAAPAFDPARFEAYHARFVNVPSAPLHAAQPEPAYGGA